jgi:hypothetical protein
LSIALVIDLDTPKPIKEIDHNWLWICRDFGFIPRTAKSCVGAGADTLAPLAQVGTIRSQAREAENQQSRPQARITLGTLLA